LKPTTTPTPARREDDHAGALPHELVEERGKVLSQASGVAYRHDSELVVERDVQKAITKPRHPVLESDVHPVEQV
jgi:hypothetical protein